MKYILENFNYIFLFTLTLFQIQFFLLNLYVKIVTKQKVRGKSFEASLFIICVVLLYSIVILKMYIPNNIIILASLVPNLTVLKYLAIVFLFTGFSLGIFSSLNLGKSWRVGISSEMKTPLVQSGMYRIIRNPYFLSFSFILVSLILTFSNILVIGISILAFALIHKMILAEEAHLLKIHGNEYIEFMRKTSRYFPPF